MDTKISILGCGWLGLPLALRLITAGYIVKGSTTTPAKLPLLAAAGIDAYLVQLGTDLSTSAQFFNSDILIINVPPGLRRQSEEAYLASMQALVKQVELSPVKQVIFISSTSVYKDMNQEIFDTDEVDIESALYQSEQLFAQSKGFQTTVIRFAGLIGPGRNPSRFFAGKSNIPNGKAPVNLIHLDDCVGIIKAILAKQKFGDTYHAAAPSHPTRSEFYTLAAQNSGLPLPGFTDELTDWKLVNLSKNDNKLDYQFVHPDLLKIAD